MTMRDRTALSATDFWSALEDELDAQAEGLRPRCIRMSKDLAIELVRSTPPLFREGPQLLRSSDTGETYWHTFTAQERTAETLERLKREEMPIRSVMTARYGDVPCRLDLALTSGFTIEWGTEHH